MTDRAQRRQALLDALASRIVVLDGAMGTMVQQKNLSAADFGGPALEGCNEVLVRTRPDVILDIHRAYLEAGSDIIETDTFGGTRIVLAEYHLENETASLIAREPSSRGRPPMNFLPRLVRDLLPDRLGRPLKQFP